MASASTRDVATMSTKSPVCLCPAGESLKVVSLQTKPIAGQKPGTSGLRKKTKLFVDGLYLHNFVQSTFDAVRASGTKMAGRTLVVGGDGRYFNPEAARTIIQIAAGNGVRSVWLARDNLLSTPAASAVIRSSGGRVFGAFILSASHNPGGPDEDFGIKYNGANGAPAPTELTQAIYANTQKVSEIKIVPTFPAVNVAVCGLTRAVVAGELCTVEVFDAVADQLALLRQIFDFDKIRALLKQKRFSFLYDSMSGVQGPYARAVFVGELGASEKTLLGATPSPTFEGKHADPNLTYAKDLVKKMGLDRLGNALPDVDPETIPCFGGAADGDADRNMILGRQFFCTPSDSLAVIADHVQAVVPYFKGGLKALARSMPTSKAVDLVAKKLGVPCFETPTGWKYFGNLMDSAEVFKKEDFNPLICGEESFGTSSNHVREKDGMWAVLCWLSILAHYNADESKPFVHVGDVVKRHWKKYGRNYYCRYDYEGVDGEKAKAFFAALTAKTGEAPGLSFEKNGVKYTIAKADIFEYTDPVDGAVAKNQGWRFMMEDGSRIVFRKSGTAGAGATIRMYLEKYVAPDAEEAALLLKTADVMGELVAFALDLSQLEGHTGFTAPTVIT